MFRPKTVRADERELFVRVADDHDAWARETLIERFLLLARSVALRYDRSAVPIEDLLQVASLGLVKAVDGFDPHRGTAFSSYAVPTIVGEIKRYFRDRTWAVHVPRDLQELALRVDRARVALDESLQRPPTVAELASKVGASEEMVLEALQAGTAHRSLSFEGRQGAGDEAPTLGESLGAADAGFARAEIRATVGGHMRILTERERRVLRMRFELDMTQDEIGAAIGVSQMQVSRIIRRALGRLLIVMDPELRTLPGTIG